MVKYVQNKQVIQSLIGEEVVMLDIESGFYFGLNSVASVIWSMMQHAITQDEIISRLMLEYDVEKNQCIADTQELIRKMLDNKIIACINSQ